jgi:predicted secreted hydrolase
MKNRLLVLFMLLLVVSCRAQGYKQALPGYKFEFPRDHFNHPDYQTEWWYYTGNLKAADGHRFGFELTFFRQAISRNSNTSAWYIHDLYMAHLALSDISGQRFYHTERINRAGPGIAGVDEHTGLIWNGNWQVQLGEDQQSLRGVDEKFGIQLELAPAKPFVIHGRDGVSQKAESSGHASHYISFTRLITSGAIEVNGATYKVDGTSWMDHEFFTESLDTNESGWDWLSLQLGDNTELMLYRLRHKDGSVDKYSSGTYVDAGGKSIVLASKDFTMTPGGETWTSEQNKGRYPVRWHVSVPGLSLELDVTTPLPSQELAESIGPSYWEGAIDATGTRAGAALRGVGYLEMTGYAAPMLPGGAR